MSICKYCKKPILDEPVLNPDEEGNGYHHVCLCEMEFISRDRQIYNKGIADVLDKIRAEIEEQKKERCFDDADMFVYRTGLDDAIWIIDKYKAESEEEE